MITRQQIIDEAERLGFGCFPKDILMPGDTYAAKRNTGITLLTVKHVKDGIVYPTELFAYPFNIDECVKVELL